MVSLRWPPVGALDRRMRSSTTLPYIGRQWKELPIEKGKDGRPEIHYMRIYRTFRAGYLYVDGHVRVYNGELATLPRRFVSRERLCLRGTTDYWVNDAVGRPFFVVSKAVTEGLADALLKDIVPELLLSVPQQPTAAELNNDPQLHRFVMVFDREGATHSLLSQLWQQRIGALTYRKNVRDVWPEGEFIEQEVISPGGGSARMKLCMRQTTLSAGKASIPVTEVRRLTPSGHQTAVITTAQRLDPTLIASRMFSRWCQENFTPGASARSTGSRTHDAAALAGAQRDRRD
jgi:prepilin-type processing-associated H-X9-DG protein